MKRSAWIEENIPRFDGQRIAVTGSTGGLGGALCRLFAARGASLLLLDRNKEKQAAHIESLRAAYPTAEIEGRTLDLSDPASVAALAAEDVGVIDVLVHNAGAYRLARKVGKWGADAAFEIDALAPLALTKALLPALKASGNGRIAVVSSIAVLLAKTNEKDPDFRTRRSQMKVYGNAKRAFTAAILAYGAREGIAVSVAHPGISQTGIVSGYPAAFRAVAEPAMRLLFPSPDDACLPIALAAALPAPVGFWYAPSTLGVWGRPTLRSLPIPKEEWDAALKMLENMI